MYALSQKKIFDKVCAEYIQYNAWCCSSSPQELRPMKNRSNISRLNVHLARTTWGDLPKAAISSLRTLSEEYALSVALGDLQLLDGRWYITHSGLLHLAVRNRCLGISTTVQTRLSEPTANRWVF